MKREQKVEENLCKLGFSIYFHSLFMATLLMIQVKVTVFSLSFQQMGTIITVPICQVESLETDFPPGNHEKSGDGFLVAIRGEVGKHDFKGKIGFYHPVPLPLGKNVHLFHILARWNRNRVQKTLILTKISVFPPSPPLTANKKEQKRKRKG